MIQQKISYEMQIIIQHLPTIKINHVMGLEGEEKTSV